MSDATSTDRARDRRWLILGVIGLAQLASIWRTQSQALPRCPSVASVVDE
jgi:hypothetical protein